jgi:serine/threonine-protein kinase
MIGTRLGGWVIDKELGRGGMGCVYLARRAAPGEPALAAIKVLAAELAVEAGFQQRFQREIDILRQLDHPHIVRFLESGQQDAWSWYVMEYVPGPSYEAILAGKGRLSWPEVLELAWQIAPALKHAHDRGIIHRDLKPSNLLRAPADGAADLAAEVGLVKLTDFGIASLFASPHLTVTGGVVGTAEYLSPEQAAGKPVTKRSDLYSLGVVLYTLATGRTPFEGEPLDLLHKHRFAQFDRPARIVPELPHEFDEIICQLLEKDPARRPADAAVLFRQLDSFKRKLAYRAAHADRPTAIAPGGQAAIDGRTSEGPATLMSRLMRQELEREKTGGPVRRFLNRPWVLLTLLALTLGLIAWALWPVSPETMYRRGVALMKSDDPDDWDRGWTEYLEPLLARDPDTPHREELEEYRRRYESRQAGRQAARAARQAGPMTEAQWFYQEGLRRRQQGDEAGAQRVWRALARAFKDVPSEGPWVRLAEKQMGEAARAERQLGPVREAVQQARRLREQGQVKEADAVLEALKELYRGDTAAQAILKGE